MNTQEPKVPLPQAALRLQKSWHRTYRLLLGGELKGEQRDGRWYVREEDVQRLEAQSSA